MLNPPTDAFEKLAELFAGRHSCRAFLPTPVPREDLTRLLQLAQQTASWCNTQPWQVLVTSGAATEAYRRRLLAHSATAPSRPDIAYPQYQGRYLRRRRICGFGFYDSLGIAQGDREASARQAAQNFHLFGAPHVAFVSSPAEMGAYGAVDCGGYIANFMLIAQSLGIATIAQAALAAHSDLVHEHFGISEQRHVVCGISFGYEDRKHPANVFRTERAPLSEAVDFRE